MGRKKKQDVSGLLTQTIIFRVTEDEYQRLADFAQKGNCHSIADAARRILSSQKITLLHKDISMDGPMEELAGIRKELRAIGININQITRHFNSSDEGQQRIFHALKVAEQYRMVDEKVTMLLEQISKLAIRWLQE